MSKYYKNHSISNSETLVSSPPTDGQRTAPSGAGEVRGRGRHSGGQDAADLRARLQQARVLGTAHDHARAHSVGYRPVQDLQRREWLLRTFYYRFNIYSIAKFLTYIHT